MPIEIGLTAPGFILIDDEGRARKLSDYLGSKVILYFYPKDDTPGCTTEACNFRNDFSKYVESGVVILGVSPDPVQSHKKFKDKYSLPFPLLADDEHKVSEAYGVWGKKKFMGKEYMGVSRTTFIIDETGKISHVFENVKPDQHSTEIISLLK